MLARDEICLEKDNVGSNMKSRFLADRLSIMGLVVGKDREGLTILEVCGWRPIRRNSGSE